MSAPEFPSDARPAPTREEHYVLEDLPDRDRMLYAALAYVFFPAPLYFARWDPFVRFHVRQGAGIAIGWLLARYYAGFAFRHDLAEVSWAGYAVVTVAAVLGIRNALALDWRGIPALGRLVNRLPLPKRLAEKTPAI